MKVALYGRVSTQKQELAIQNTVLRDYVKRQGWKIYGAYYDKLTGTTDDRPRLIRLLKDAKRKKFDLVLVTKIDRMARSLKHLIAILERLDSNNIKFVCTDQPIDTSTPMGKLVLQILGAVAEFERTLILERTKAGVERAKRQGKICHRPRKHINEGKLRKYVEKGYAISVIAGIFDVTPSTIVNRMKEFGIEKRSDR
jgi:DNA invertase Pin-like site-specific DNA recombinase